jgi:asparagine N-glycosylation enzyme membrane subunit Stt3
VRLHVAVLGFLLVGLIYLLGKELGGRRAGLIAALLAGLAFLPLARLAWQSSSVFTIPRSVPAIVSLLTTTPVILLLRQVPAGWLVLAAPGAVLALVGAAWATRRDASRGLTVILYVAVPLSLLFALSVSCWCRCWRRVT